MTTEAGQRGGAMIWRRPKERQDVSVHSEWEGRSLPALVRANRPGLHLAEWIGLHNDQLDSLARTHGGVLLRAFAMNGADDFAAVMNALSGDVLSYGERSSPRTEVATGVYTSTDHPADQPIQIHNEQSYTLDWPLRIVFYCDVEPSEGGRTPLVDSRRILARLRPQTVAKFERLGVAYVRNYLAGISLPWQEAFQTSDRSEVEAYCERQEIDCEWVDDSHLRTRQVRPAIRIHPYTLERTWFNHALFFHVTSLPGEVSAGLRSALPEEDLPYHTYYGDGSPIGDDVLAELRGAFEAETHFFGWRHGDVLLVENMLAAHGREPFRGPRRILVAMADARSRVGR
jgi:alpha-ketoglutarate-dependent taurine dioxygenase